MDNGAMRTVITREDESVTLCKGTDDEMICIGYRRARWKEVTFALLVILTLGILFLITRWKPVWRVILTCRRCKLCQADRVVLRDLSSSSFIEEIIICDLSDTNVIATYRKQDSATSNKPLSLDGMVDYAYVSQSRATPTCEDDRSALTLKTKILLKYFEHKHMRFVWKDDAYNFVKLRGLDWGVKCQDILDNFTGLSKQERVNKLVLFGTNSILVEVKSYLKLLVEEVLNPFYIFQIFSVALWFSDNYYIYASCIVVISTVSLGVELYETRKQRETLRDMVASADTTISVFQANGDIAEISSHDLVPGDVIVVPPHRFMMSCDAVLIAGNAIVDEGMLTGESVPVTKTPLAATDADEIYSPEIHKRNTLFCGTNVIQTRYYGDAKVKAVVIRTGFSTAKGELVRSILYPKELMFKFYEDAFRFVLFLAGIAAIGMVYVCVNLVLEKSTVRVIVINMLDIITVAVPPALPAAMTVGIIFAQARLKRAGIFCISPQRINLAGKLQRFCFDKTGTLTEEGLDLWAVIPAENGTFRPVVHEPPHLSPSSRLIVGMATCHSLTIIDKELSGDPLDLKMFNSINWVLEEAGRETEKFDLLIPTVVKPIVLDTYSYDQLDRKAADSAFEVGIVKQFTFSSGLQRMSVVVRVLGADHMDAYVKGAPEKIAGLCDPDTLPDDFQGVLQKYAAQGLRVIAVAYKPLDSKISWHQIQRISRETVESDLSFVGLLIMENKLKPETTPVIRQLRNANIPAIMVTGDNILTAISVARHCGIVGDDERLVVVNAQPPEGDKPASIRWEEDVPIQDQSSNSTGNGHTNVQSYQSSNVITDLCNTFRLAVSGRSFGIIHRHFPSLVSKIALHGAVFARMTPDQKTKLIEDQQDLGFSVGMCGDGANDCGALRTADVGISLSEAEASVASPFTSKTANISCVPTVIREGRAALTTSLSAFRFMALYSIIQFVSVLILISERSKLGDYMFLYADLMIITVLALLMGRTGAYSHLVAKRPTSSLSSSNNIFGVMVHILIILLFQLLVFFYVQQQPWYESAKLGNDGEPSSKTMDTTAVFYISSFQYLILAFVLSKGPPYRKRIWTNVPFLVWLLLMVAFTLLLVIYPPKFLQNVVQLVSFPSLAFTLTLIGLACINLLLVLLFEDFVIHNQLFKSCTKSIFCMRKKLKQYKTLKEETDEDNTWPPVGEVTTAGDQDAIWHIGVDIS